MLTSRTGLYKVYIVLSKTVQPAFVRLFLAYDRIDLIQTTEIEISILV